MPRITVGFRTSPRSSARSSVSRRKPSTRVQSPTYGEGGHCAWIPTSRSIVFATGSRRRSSSSWRARVARLSSCSVSVRPRTRPTLSAWPSASAWLPAPPAPPRRRRPHRRSSTGSSPATRAASSGSGSRTPTRSREVAEAVEQIQESLRWLGIDWDGPLTFQLDRMDDCRRVAERARRGRQGVRGRGRDPLSDAGRGLDRLGRRRPRPRRVSRTRSSRTS